jgi:hypothetical protein
VAASIGRSAEIRRRCAALHLLFAGNRDTQALDQVYLLCRSLKQLLADEPSLAQLQAVEERAARFFCGPAPESLRPQIVRALVLLGARHA